MRLLAIALTCVLVSLACDRGASEGAPPAALDRYETRGRIERIASRGGATTLDIQHEAIPAIRGYDGTVRPMKAMSMPFAVGAGVPIDGLAVGTPVAFTFEVDYRADPTLRVIAIRALPADTALDLP